ncbi:polysaccharide deacetylase family protein [Winogradskyella alexanderae]|uniref:Polysaccharide deacetylase family protein n=1 Tax=Winogradskyella alexanderae TaxID=2877123 RepID=A0ABS7XQ77_9FLAO|nr:polysaccharide deacetylase family protein [Winogradskyella alexanderae]MCA0130991.1 polysaccharide deacetylase family protein [Winogradskyella alexanderae]
MQVIPAKTPDFVKSLFPNLVWNITTNNKELYLTFDDGPTPEITVWVLDILRQYNAKATFFCIGNNIEKHPKLFSKVIDQGHAIGNHTFNHLKGWRHTTKNYIKDVVRTESLIDSFHTDHSENYRKFFRPPYGKFKVKQSKKLQELGYNIIMWDVLSYDWDSSIKAEDCLKNVISSAKAGSIVVFHDSIKAYKNLQYTLPEVLEYYTTRGYTFKALY